MKKSLMMMLACAAGALPLAAQSDTALAVDREADALAIAEQLYRQARALSADPASSAQLYSRAADLFADFVRRYPNSRQRSRAHYLQAVCLEALGNQQAAVRQLESIAALYNDEYGVSASYRLASLASQNKNWDRAAQYYSSVVKNADRRDLRDDATYRLGRAYMMLSQYARAEQCFHSLMSRPQEVRADILQSTFYLISQMKIQQGDDRAAYGHLRSLLSLPNLNPKLEGAAILQAARLAAQLGSPDESQRYYARLSQMDGMQAYAGEAQLQNFSWLFRNKDYRKIIELSSRSLPELGDPAKNALRNMIIGQSYMELRDYGSAQMAFRNAWEDQPEGVSGADAMYRMIVCMLQQGSPEFLSAASRYLQTYAVPGKETADLPCTNLVRLMYADRLMISDVAEAARQFDAINIEKLPRSSQADAYYKKAWTANESSSYDPVPSLDFFIKEFPDDARMPEALTLRGSALLKQKKLDAALADFDRVIREFPNSKAVAVSLQQAAQACARNNRSERMKDYYLALVKLKTPVTPQALAEANYCIAGYYVKEDPKQAIPHYEEAARLDPSHYEEQARYYLVWCYYKLQDVAKLRESLDALEQKFPERYKTIPSGIPRWCGWMCYQNGDSKAAAKYLCDAVARAPKEDYTTADGKTAQRPKVDALVWKTLAQAYLELCEYAKGLEASNHYLELETRPYPRAEGMRDAAMLLVGLGRTEEARKLCEDAIKMGIDGPIKSSVFLALGDTYYAEKQYSEAAKHYGRTANIVSDKDLKPLSLYKIVCALKKDHKDGEARQYEESLSSEFPNWTPPDRVRRLMEGK